MNGWASARASERVSRANSKKCDIILLVLHKYLFYSTLEILNILACSANFLVVYVKICGEYLAVTSHYFEFARLNLWLTLAHSHLRSNQRIRKEGTCHFVVLLICHKLKISE